jgi:hypothetical protein
MDFQVLVNTEKEFIFLSFRLKGLIKTKLIMGCVETR